MNYQQHKEKVLAAQQEKSVKGRDISGGWDQVEPSPEDLELRERCRLDLRLFLISYFPATFDKPFSADQEKVIAKIQAVVLSGGMSAVAMPRGSGKTSIMERALIWAIVYGHHRYALIVGAVKDLSSDNLKTICAELSNNDHLLRPFRYVCYPFRALQGETRRAMGQMFKGQRTAIKISEDRLVMPTMPDSPCSGSVISALSITGALRGLKATMPDGATIRPSLILCDDPQTRESALSPGQTADRLATLNGDVLGLRGPSGTVSVLCACTCIRRDDLSDQLLDRQKCPQWQGIRTKAVYSWPSDPKLWEAYLELRSKGLREDRGTAEATAFYQSNQTAMDAGTDIAWPSRHEPHQLSAVQWAIDLRADMGDEAFSAEYQNDPQRPQDEDVPMLSAGEIASKTNGYPRLIVPADAAHVVAMIDVGDSLLHYCLIAASPEFDVWIIDYGIYPDQGRPIESSRKAVRTLGAAAPGASKEGAIRAGLDALTAHLCSREYQREDGATMRLSKCLIDTGYLPDTIYDAIRASPHAAVLQASRGRYIGPAHTPMDHFPKRPGEQMGHRWMIPAVAKGRSQRRVEVDANYWKTFSHARLSTALGDKACATLFKADPQQHQIFASHLTSEYATRTTANGRTVDLWTLRPAHENHWFDAYVGSLVAASMMGAALPGAQSAIPKPPKPLSLSALYAEKRTSTQSLRTTTDGARQHNFGRY